MNKILYEEMPLGNLIEYKEYRFVVMVWSLGLFNLGLFLSIILSLRPEDSSFWYCTCIFFILLSLLYFVLGRSLMRGFVEDSQILLSQNTLRLASPVVRTIPVGHILKIVFDSAREKIIIYLKNGQRICLDRTFGNLFDMVKGTREEDLRIAPLLKALKEAGIKYEIIWREM